MCPRGVNGDTSSELQTFARSPETVFPILCSIPRGLWNTRVEVNTVMGGQDTNPFFLWLKLLPRLQDYINFTLAKLVRRTSLVSLKGTFIFKLHSHSWLTDSTFVLVHIIVATTYLQRVCTPMMFEQFYVTRNQTKTNILNLLGNPFPKARRSTFYIFNILRVFKYLIVMDLYSIGLSYIPIVIGSLLELSYISVCIKARDSDTVLQG